MPAFAAGLLAVHLLHHRRPRPHLRLLVDAPRPASRALELTVLAQVGQQVLHHVDGHREADALPLADDGRVHAHHLAAHVEERPARVARVDERVRLDEVVEEAHADHPLLGGDHPVRHRVVQPERVADGHHPVAHLQPVRVPQVHRRQPAHALAAAAEAAPRPWRSPAPPPRRGTRARPTGAPRSPRPTSWRATTWLFVTTSPSGVRMKPEPVAERLAPSSGLPAPMMLMFTTPASTARMSGASEVGGTKPGSIGSFEPHSRHSPIGPLRPRAGVLHPGGMLPCPSLEPRGERSRVRPRSGSEHQRKQDEQGGQGGTAAGHDGGHGEGSNNRPLRLFPEIPGPRSRSGRARGGTPHPSSPGGTQACAGATYFATFTRASRMIRSFSL